MAKYELSNITFMLFMNFGRNPLPVVPNSDHVLLRFDIDLDLGHRMVTLVVIGSVD